MPELETNEITPRSNNYLLGQEEAEKVFLDAWKNNSLHNSWLISGIEGIGKATLAYRFARFVFAADNKNKEQYTSLNVSESNPVFNLVVNNSHPDLKIIERDYTDTDRRKIIKSIKDGERLNAEEMSGLKKSAVIKIDDVRTINDFLSKKSSQDGWRVVIVDSIDDMNNASANAILKVLEEPPYKTLMLLISHNPNRLLPTIKSRCAKLNLRPLSSNHVASLLRRYQPDLAEKEVKNISELCSGSIGKAINFANNNAVEKYDRLCKIIGSGNKYKLADLLSFCDTAVADEESYDLVKELILKFVAENITKSENIEALAGTWEEAIRVFEDTDKLNLDKKQALIKTITSICKVI